MLLPAMASSAIILATPATLADVIAHAKAGAQIKLAPGRYGAVTIKNKSWSNAITIDATGATMTLAIENSKGVNINGGGFGPATGPGPLGYGALVRLSSNINFSNNSFVGNAHGLVIDRSNHVAVSKANLIGQTIDGIDIGSSQHITISDSACSGFNTGLVHPDCIQGWSRPGAGITQDVTLLRNSSSGRNQGFTFFNHVRNGVDDGGFDRITLIGNYVYGNYYPQGIALYSCRNCTATGNTTKTAFGSPWRISINIVGCSGCKISGNSMGAKPLTPTSGSTIRTAAVAAIRRPGSATTKHATPTAVPEPGTWALMISGFGLAGAALRRRRRSARLALAG